MTVNLGTLAQATALTIFAPFFAIPPSSAVFPIINPVDKKWNGNTSDIL
jgi:hypothetical protein